MKTIGEIEKARGHLLANVVQEVEHLDQKLSQLKQLLIDLRVLDESARLARLKEASNAPRSEEAQGAPSVEPSINPEDVPPRREAILVYLQAVGDQVSAREVAAALRRQGYGQKVSWKNFYASVTVSLMRMASRQEIVRVYEISPGSGQRYGLHEESTRDRESQG